MSKDSDKERMLKRQDLELEKSRREGAAREESTPNHGEKQMGREKKGASS